MPGGTLSNFFCWLFGADLTLSIAMTTASSLSSFIFITINSLVYIPIISEGTELKIDYMSLLMSGATLVMGILCGLYVSYRCKQGSQGFATLKKVVAWIATVIFGVGSVVALIFNFLGYVYSILPNTNVM